MANEKKLKCGLIMPISAIDVYTSDHWEEVRAIIREALSDTEFDVKLVSDSDDVGVIQKHIVQNIYDNDIVICDVSAKNPNVMFELGMRLAFDKPAIIIKDRETLYSFDTAPIEHLEYPRNLHYATINSFKIKLREKVINTYSASKDPNYTTFLKHFGKFVVAQVDEKSVGKDEYIMQAITDLRSEVFSLAKTVTSQISIPSPTKQRSVMTSKFPASMAAYFTVKCNNPDFDPVKIANDKAAFDAFFEEYYQQTTTMLTDEKWHKDYTLEQFKKALSLLGSDK